MKGFLRLVLVVAVLLPVFCYAAAESDTPVLQFEIKSYAVEGNSLVPADRLKAVLAPFTGKRSNLDTVRRALEALENEYRRRGYTTVRVTLPEQELENGIIRLGVIEGRFGNVVVQGNKQFDTGNIRRSLPGIREGRVPEVDTISKELKLANENPAKKAVISLQTGTKADEIDADIKVKDEKPWKTGATVDTTGNRETGRWRTGAFFQHANIFNRDQLLTLQYITSPDRPADVHIYGVGYRVPFYSLGSSLDFIGAYSDVDSGVVSAAGSSLSVSGKGTVLGLHYNQNLGRTGNYEHKAIVGFDYLAFRNHVVLENQDIGNDVTVHPLSLTYAGVYMREVLSLGVYLTYARNLPGGWAGKDSADYIESSRSAARQQFQMLRYGLSALYLFAGWQARAVLNGQYTNDALIPGEQYGLGGATTVRGFYERQTANDKGYSSSIEIYTPDFGRFMPSAKALCRALAFYDFGRVWRNEALPQEVRNTTVSSTGVGMRIEGRYFTIATDLAFVLDSGGHSSRYGGFGHLAASYMF